MMIRCLLVSVLASIALFACTADTAPTNTPEPEAVLVPIPETETPLPAPAPSDSVVGQISTGTPTAEPISTFTPTPEIEPTSTATPELVVEQVPPSPTFTPEPTNTPVPTATPTATMVPDPPDLAALVALFNATDGPNWRRSDNWLSGRPLGDWHGVTTQNGRVVYIDLHENNLDGALPPEIGTLSELIVLNLEQNEITGSIPPEIGELAKLVDLFLVTTNSVERYRVKSANSTGSKSCSCNPIICLERYRPKLVTWIHFCN